MIISDDHRYVFVELPRTGSTAIAAELCELYDGRPFLGKHATYSDFLKAATRQQRDYFVFSCIRNPLDEAVSFYFKAKNDPDNSFSRLKQTGLITRLIHGTRIRRHDFTKRPSADFEAYLRRFYVLPYSSWAILNHKRFDYVIRFEDLSKGFSAVLRRLNLEEIRPLPQVNPTAERARDYLSYYPPSIQRRASFVFGPFMEEWDYQLPAQWSYRTISRSSRALYHLVNVPRRLYWRYARPFARRLTRF